MKKYSLLFLLLFSAFGIAQEKKNFTSLDKIISAIEPSAKSWALLKNTEELINKGDFYDYQFQSEGFKLDPNEETFYYIAYSNGGKVNYITSLHELGKFIGKINNVEEAAIKAITEGYYIDLEFKDIAANYYQKNGNYFLEIGKITSLECPYQKRSYSLIINEVTGKITTAKENETYTEIYKKDCKNNPDRFIPPKKEKKKEVISIYR